MNILLTSRPFFPEIGGLCPIAYLAAKDWQRRGHQVRLLTMTPGRFEGEDELVIIRRPGWRALLEHYRWCDVVFQNHVNIRFALPLLFVRRPLVVSASGWVDAGAARSTTPPGLRQRLVLRVLGVILRAATRNVAACAAVAAGNRVPARIIPNPFDAEQFRVVTPPGERSDELLFVGRLVSDKGVDDLIRAVALLRARGVRARVAVAGDGPERAALGELAHREGVSDRVRFLGPLRGGELVERMNAHRLLVVPSQWNEPIGIVSLEALACGCAVLGSEGGGLAVSIGPCGLTYPNGDYHLLAERIAEMLALGSELEPFTRHAAAHLERYRPERVCGEYLDEIVKAQRAWSSAGG